MSNRSSIPSAEEKWALPRRDFLRLGSVAVVGAAASSVTAATLRVVAAPEVGSVLSIGYSEHVAPATEANEAAVVPARTLRMSDGSFRSSGARVTVHGFSATEKNVSVRLSTFAPAGEAAVPFLAWAHSARATSPRVSFTASLDENGTLPFAIERRETGSRFSRLFAPVTASVDTLPELTQLEEGGNVCRLTSGDRGDARLRAGTYFIALRRTSADRQPDWNAISVDATAVDASTALRRCGQPVDFEYVAVTVTNPIA